ncbi:ribonuclease H-like domain-containing protein [Tanacetum coccineum]
MTHLAFGIARWLNDNKALASLSFAHQELLKIVKDEIYPIVNQVDARVQNFKIQFLKEATKFIPDCKSLANEADESLAKHKTLEFKIKHLLRVVVSQDIKSIVQNPTVVETSDLKTELEHTLDPLSQKRKDENVSLEFQNGNSFKPAATTTTNVDGSSTTLIPGPVTADEKTQKKNDVKARNAKTLFAAIQTRFDGNDATKKTQKTLLKQMYENFSAPSTESLDSIFNRLQKIVIRLAILGENISQKDPNLKFLRSLPSEWNTYVMVWRNKPDLDTISFDDLYNNFIIIEQEVKGSASSSSSSQNVAFVSSSSSANEVNTAYGFSTTNSQVSPASTQVSTTNDLEEMDLKWQLALLSIRTRRFFQKTSRKITINGSDTTEYDKSKVKFFNCHKMGHFARECRGPRNQNSRNKNQDNSRRTINVEEISSKAMLAIDGAGFDWSFMVDEEVLTDMALMDFLDSEPEFESYGPKISNSVSEDISNEVMKSFDAPLVEELVSNDKLEKKTVFPTVAKINFVKHQEKPVRKPVKYAEMYRSQTPRGNQRN